MKDMKGAEFAEGCTFLKPCMYGRSPFLEERVANLRNGKLYSEGSKVPIQHPERCYIVLYAES